MKRRRIMKKKRERRITMLLAIMMVLINLFASPVWAEPGEVVINELRFPDEIFRTYVLENFDTNKSGTLSKDELDAVKEIYLNGKNISSLKGVEYFTELKSLYCSSNKLTDLDITKNLYLKELYCHENQLTALNVSNNTALTRLYCSKNQLTDLDVSKNIALEGINCDGNQLTALNVSNNTALQRLSCNENQLTDLDVTKNLALKSLGCSKNQLTDLDVSKNIALEELYCSKNQLTTLDVSKNTELKTLRCNGNQLTSLDLKGNTNITTFNGDDQKYDIEVDGSALTFDLTSLAGNFDSLKASGWVGGSVSGNTLTLDPSKPDKVTYTYDAGNGKDLSVRLNVTYTGVPIVPPIPTNPAKPKAQKPKHFEYDGTEKQVTLLGFDEATMELSGDIKKTDVGVYTLYVTPKTGTWSDGSTDDVEIEWEIMRANIEGNITHSTVVKDGSTLGDIIVNTNFTFNGNKVEGTFSWTNESFAALPDDTSVEYQKAYTWIFKPNNKNLNQRTGQAVLYPYKEFVVSFDVNGHGTAPADQIVKEGKQATEPSAPTDLEYNFGGWYTEAECTNEYDFTQAVNDNITLYAKWAEKAVIPTPTQYTLTASVEGGHGSVSPTTKTVNKNDAIVVEFTPDEGYEIDTVKVNDTVVTIAGNTHYILMDGDKTVVVKYKEKAVTPEPPTPEQFKVTFDANGGEGTMADVTKNKDEQYTLPACTFTPPAGKEFKAWQVDGTEKNVGDNIVLNGDKNIKAVWKDIGSAPPTPPVPPTPDIPTPNPYPYPHPYPYPYPWTRYPGYWYNIETPKPKEEVKSTSVEIDWKLELMVGVSTLDRDINGVDSKIKMDVAPYIRDGRTMLPIRYVAEALGFDVEWNRSTRTVVLKNSNTRVEIPVDTNKIIVNGKIYTSDVKPEIKNNRTMLPIANIARALGLEDGKDIVWNSKSKIVTIYRSIVVK